MYMEVGLLVLLKFKHILQNKHFYSSIKTYLKASVLDFDADNGNGILVFCFPSLYCRNRGEITPIDKPGIKNPRSAL